MRGCSRARTCGPPADRAQRPVAAGYEATGGLASMGSGFCQSERRLRQPPEGPEQRSETSATRPAGWPPSWTGSSADPATLPVEQATELRLALNLKTAKTLGPTIPPAVGTGGRSDRGLRSLRELRLGVDNDAARPNEASTWRSMGPPSREEPWSPGAGVRRALPTSVQVRNRAPDRPWAARTTPVTSVRRLAKSRPRRGTTPGRSAAS
jgi:hypothetical protein